MNREYGFLRVAAITPKLKVANVDYNVNEIIKEIKNLASQEVAIAVFPELSITGYTCADLFLQDALLNKTLKGIETLLEKTKDNNITFIVGAPLIFNNDLLNCALVISKGKILGIIPKSYIPNYSEFYERRWFTPASNIRDNEINFLGRQIPIGTDLIFQDKTNPNVSFGIEICEDMWAPLSPSTNACLNGATMIFNLSASNEVIGKYEFRKDLIKINSAKNICAYIYSSAGIHESSTDLVFSGFSAIYENGSLLKENKRFNEDTSHIIMDIDINKIMNERMKNKSYTQINSPIIYRKIDIEIKSNPKDLLRTYSKYPFVPEKAEKRKERCEEIINIVTSALAKRINHTGLKKCVIGMSGGLDSTLAFLFIIKTYQKLGISPDHLIAVTMPGFGTSKRTYENALSLMKSYQVTQKEIDIKEVTKIHLKDIGLDKTDRSVTYENAQARERTKILMDIANKEGGLVIGTGDLSELALGWCTYNGDHMSMYALNASIPKTLVRYLVAYFADIEPNKDCQKTILDILATPISPELLPPNEQKEITQKTENIVGPYLLHDFFLYHMMRYGASPNKIRYIAKNTFKDRNEEEIDKWLTFFIKRFFNQQFKRSCLPDGPKVGTISLSPRGDLRMPSDADNALWLE